MLASVGEWALKVSLAPDFMQTLGGQGSAGYVHDLANRTHLLAASNTGRGQLIMVNEKDIVKEVVDVLHDGHKGFADLAEHVKEPEVRSYFLKESQTRSQYASELESAAGLERDESGTAGGALHRAWGDLKGKMGGGDHTLLETAEQGEDASKKAYEDALKDAGAIRPAIRQLLEKQQAHIKQSHDQVKALRDSKKAA
jgi:uncharacterized protein (TIGR02284 family)